MIIEKVCQYPNGIGESISCTTRKASKKKDGTYEQHGVDYFFIEKPEFEAHIVEDGFFEYADVKGNLYGTPRAYVEKLISNDNDVIILNIENDSVAQVKLIRPTIFILSPSAQELRRRLVDREPKHRNRSRDAWSKALSR